MPPLNKGTLLTVAILLLLVAGAGFFLWPTDDTVDTSLRGASMPVAPNSATPNAEQRTEAVAETQYEGTTVQAAPTLEEPRAEQTQPTPAKPPSTQGTQPSPTKNPSTPAKSAPTPLSPWEAIKYAVQNCEVDAVFQTESLRVTAKMKNGERLVATEPKIDEIIRVARAAEPRCGKIGIATE